MPMKQANQQSIDSTETAQDSQQDHKTIDPIEKYTINGVRPINGTELEHSLKTSEVNGSASTEKQHLWKPGQSGNPSGRTKGSKNRKQLESQFYADLAADWNDHGIQAVTDLREQNPIKYVQLVASVMPKTMELDDSGGVRWVINAQPLLSTDQWLEHHNLQPVDNQDNSDN